MNVDAMDVSHGPRPVEIEVVRGALTRLSLLAQALSGAQQGDPERYADTFSEALGDPLRNGGEAVTLIVQDGAIFYAGTEVSGNDLIIRGIVHRLEADGVSAVTFLPHITREELIEICNLLASPLPEGSAGQFGARAWHLNLPHVHLETIATEAVTTAAANTRPSELTQQMARELGVTDDTLEIDAHLELAATLAGQRALADIPPTAPAAEPVSDPKWVRTLQNIQSGRDMPDALLSLLVIESLRTSHGPDETKQTAEAWLDQVQRAFASGNPLLAGHLMRPVLISADPQFRPVGFDAAPVLQALAAFLSPRTGESIATGIKLHPQTDDWTGVLFSLGGCANGDSLLDLATMGHPLGPGPIREALGDGLAMAVDRIEGASIRDLLSRAEEAALPVLLQAARRFVDPTLIEPLLARVRHEQTTVREAALLALRAQQSPRIKVAARAAIGDPARAVRLEALRYVSVYRDTESTSVVAERIRTAEPGAVDLAELRALAIAWFHTSRGEALAEIEALAASPNPRHPDLPAACVVAMARAGVSGRQALDRLGRSQPELRQIIREHSTPRGPESRS